MLDRNSVQALLEECFWDDIEALTIECVSEFDSDELAVIFTECMVDYAQMEEIE